MNADQALLDKLNVAVAAANEAEQAVSTARTELVSRSKTVGALLLEAKRLHPKVADFEAFLKRVNGLKLSRAYDYLRIAGGRATDEQLREEARARQKKSRENKKKILPPPEKPTEAEPKQKPKPVSVTDPRVTESPEISAEQRRGENARMDEAAQGSAHHLADFKIACRKYLPKMTAFDQIAAVSFVQEMLATLKTVKTARAAAKKAKAA